jgi:hypothetical protein
MASLEGRAVECRTFAVQTFVQVNVHVGGPLDTARAHPCPILRARGGHKSSRCRVRLASASLVVEHRVDVGFEAGSDAAEESQQGGVEVDRDAVPGEERVEALRLAD